MLVNRVVVVVNEVVNLTKRYKKSCRIFKVDFEKEYDLEPIWICLIWAYFMLKFYDMVCKSLLK